MNQMRALLFPDWDLETLLLSFDPTREDDFSYVVGLIQGDQLAEAEEWLANEISRYPWMLMAAAQVKLKMEETAEAGRLLRAVTLLSSDARLRLWAWHNLRLLGKYPSPDLGRQVLGVIIEVPFEERMDTLAAYADGTARYINHQGGVIVWDRVDETITPLVMAVIRESAQDKMAPLGALQEERVEAPIPDGAVRLNLLTPAGIYVWQGAPSEAPAQARIFTGMADLLRALVQVTVEQRREQDEDE
ncbi:MAG TPA: hypothetical protein VF806_10130 [Anaerolineaceae bacterium]